MATSLRAVAHQVILLAVMCPLGLRSGDCAACGTGDTCVGNDGAEGPSPARHPLRIEVFFDAVREHDLAAARKLLERTPALVDATQPFGITPLHAAAEVDDTAMIDLLVRCGAEVNSCRQGADETPLAAAVRMGQVKAARALLAHGADLGFTSGNGQSLLSIAARHGHEELVRLLLDRKLAPNGGVPADWPLRTAASAGHLEIVKLLVARGADVKGERRDGSPILAYPIGAWKAEIVAYLRAAGAELPLPSAVELGELDYAESLLREHALAEARRGDAEAALWLAVERGYTRFVAELLARGVDVNVFGRDGETLLEHIDNSIQDSPRSHLLGLRQVVCDYGGLTGACLVSPLPDFAAEAKARRVRFGRLDYWPDSRTMADSRGKATPFVDPQAAWLHELQTAPVEQIAERLNSDPGLAKRGAMDDVSPLHVAAASGRMEVARILVANGADVNRISDQYGTPLHQAVREHRVEIVGWLLTRKADVNASLATTGLTPLHLAAALGHAETVQLLLDAGADPKLVLRGYKPRFETPPDGLTPLVLAAGAGKLEAVQRLYSVVTDDRADDDRKAWAMRWAADRGQRAVVEWLLVRGAPCDMVTALWGVDEAARKDPKEVAWRAAAVVARSRLPAACELGTLSELREYAAAQPTRLAYWGKEFEGVPVPLGYAILGNQPEIVTFLLENDVPRRSDLFRDRLASAWKLAVRLRRTEAAIAILNAGLDLKDLTLD